MTYVRAAPHNEIAVIVREYKPNVLCDSGSLRAPDPESCDVAIEKMPASYNIGTYSSRDYKGSERSSRTPIRYYDTSRLCKFTLLPYHSEMKEPCRRCLQNSTYRSWS